MARFSIYSKDGGTVRYTGTPKYSGSYLNVGKLEFSNVSSPVPIQWEIGDYVDYYRTGLRYRLYSLPEPKKQARPGEYGAAFVYSDVVLYAATQELDIAPYRDLVDSDNGIHFSSRKDFSTYEDVYGIARRIQACMDDLYPDKWRIEVFQFNEEDADIMAKISEVKEFTSNGESCLDALGKIYETWEQIGWVHSYDETERKDVITIGRANKRDSGNTSDAYRYGKGNGLKSIKKTSANKDEFCTRLYVYGAERNIIPRYYNSKSILHADSVDIPNLMIPVNEWGRTDGMPDARKAYIEADKKIIARYGIIPRTVYFDGGEFDEIFPSIEGVTAGDIRAAKKVFGDIHDIPDIDKYPDEYRIDQIYDCTNPDDDGIYIGQDGKQITLKQTFKVIIPQIGFNINEQTSLTSEGKAIISMKSGMCAGREFIVRSCKYFMNSNIGWEIELQRVQDESTGMMYPNTSYAIETGDKFVILEIAMPEIYVGTASQRLIEHGRKLLSDYSRVSPVYEPDMDSIVLSKGGKLLTEGMYLQMEDADIIDTEDSTDYVLIDSISINEDESNLPVYKVTLRDSKRAAKSYGALEDMVDDAEKNTNEKIERQRKYTERRFTDALETISMLQGALENFSDGISPVTVQTMMLLLGDKSMQFIFTDNRDSLASVPAPLKYNNATRQVTSVPATIVHLTIGIDSISPEGSRKVDDYFRWDIKAFNSIQLEDASKKYYVYAKVAAPDADGQYEPTGVFILSEISIGMESEDGYYHLLVGILNSEYNGDRSFVLLYGFTEILPGQITTDIIRSSDGKTYFDLLNGIISGKIHFTSGSSGLSNIEEYADRQTEIDESISQYDYLRKALPKGGTTIDGGVVLANVLGLLDPDMPDKVEAFVNGSDIGKDDTHGKLLLAGGVPDGSETLGERAKSAKTRVYEDGLVKTERLEANGGKIGAFTIDEQGLKGTSYSGASETEENIDAQLALTKTNIRYAKKGRAEVLFGSETTSASTLMNIGLRAKLVSASLTNIGLLVEADKSGLLSGNTVLPNLKGDYAMIAPHGKHAGLRPETRLISYAGNYYLTGLDHTVIIGTDRSHPSASYTASLYLPSSPEDGQEYVIIKQPDTVLRIYCNGHAMNSLGEVITAPASYVQQSGDACEIHLVYMSDLYYGNYEGCWVRMYWYNRAAR